MVLIMDYDSANNNPRFISVGYQVHDRNSEREWSLCSPVGKSHITAILFHHEKSIQCITLQCSGCRTAHRSIPGEQLWLLTPTLSLSSGGRLDYKDLHISGDNFFLLQKIKNIDCDISIY